MDHQNICTCHTLSPSISPPVVNNYGDYQKTQPSMFYQGKMRDDRHLSESTNFYFYMTGTCLILLYTLKFLAVQNSK